MLFIVGIILLALFIPFFVVTALIHNAYVIIKYKWIKKENVETTPSDR